MEVNRKNKTLIFDLDLTGHHIEYLNHLYINAGLKTEEDFIFAVPEDFLMKSSNRDWPIYKNAKFYFIKQYQVNRCKGTLLSSSFNACKLLSHINKNVHANSVILITLMPFIPFLPIFIAPRVKISGIIYKIYLHQWGDFQILEKAENILKYIIISKSNVIKSAYILNDEASAAFLNRKYRTKKFQYLPDPVLPININNIDGFRVKMNIIEDVKIILHFGILSDRKGTFEILKMISLMDCKTRLNYAFIFAGIISTDIKESFYKLYSELKDTSQIYIFDEFCSFELLGSFCKSADYILIPYKSTFLSSGLLGYAAQFKTPVIGPGNGLLGKLIRRYKLGFTLKETSANSLLEFFVNKNDNILSIPSDSSKYLTDNSVTKFLKVIMP